MFFSFLKKEFYLDRFNDSEKIIIVKEGMTTSDVSKILIEKQIIKSELSFKFWLKLNFLEKKIKFGEYVIPKNTSLNEVVKIITSGKSLSRFITIVEGTFKNKIIESFKEKKNINLKEINIPEYIIANTYSFTINNDFKSIFDIIKKENEKILNKIWSDRDKSIPIKNKKELFILSSIVELESGKKSEKNKIAGVFYNRINEGMRLQSDPTVIFAITKGKKLDRKLLRKDLKFKSDYNTYTNKGLPPGPICYPSIETLKAVSKPYKGNFFYFVADKDGGHLFSETYEEHKYKINLVKKKSN